MGGIRLDGFAAIDERSVLIVAPEIQQIGIVRAFRLAGLARDAGEDGTVPVGEVEDVTIRRAVYLRVVRPGGAVGGVGAATSLDRAAVENGRARIGIS